MISASKNEEDAAADFDLDRMMLKDNTVAEVDMEEPKKAKAGSGEHKTMEGAPMRKDS